MLSNTYREWFRKERHEPYAVGSVEAVEGFFKLIPPTKKTVLVIGCGEGYEVAWFNSHGFKATGITANEAEALAGKKRYKVKILVKDMHELGDLPKFDAIYASNVLEHSPMPFLALYHWRKYLKKNGYLVIVLPSKEWLTEFYHYSVMTRSQTKDLLYKSGFKLLAGPQMEPKVKLNRGANVFLDMGRLWGFQDAYLAKLTKLPKEKPMLNSESPNDNVSFKSIIKGLLKYPYNKVRVWYAQKIREW